MFQETIKDFFNSSNLSVKINLLPPDCHQIDLTDPKGKYVSKSIYVRVRVENIKGKTAQNVEILLSNLWKIENDGKLNAVSNFLPMNLVWSHTHPTKEVIPPRSFRFCDLGCFRPIEGYTVFKFDTVVQPNPVSGGIWPNIIQSGKYMLEVLISGENVQPKFVKWIIEFEKDWSDDEEEMLSRVKIKLLKPKTIGIFERFNPLTRFVAHN